MALMISVRGRSLGTVFRRIIPAKRFEEDVYVGSYHLGVESSGLGGRLGGSPLRWEFLRWCVKGVAVSGTPKPQSTEDMSVAVC